MVRNERRKHVPQRTCIVCRCTLGKRDLNRIVRSPEGVHFDPTGKALGRGAYLCQNPRCWEQAIQSSALDRALKAKLKIEESAALRSEFESRKATESTIKE